MNVRALDHHRAMVAIITVVPVDFLQVVEFRAAKIMLDQEDAQHRTNV